MAHKIDISDKTYDALKEYCTLNGIKIGQFADRLLYEGLMIEKYGNVPFTNYKKPLPEPPKPEEPVAYQVQEKKEEIKSVPAEVVKPVETEEVKPKEKKDFNELYKNIAESDWFKKAYSGKSITTEEEPQSKPKTIKRRLK